MLRKVFSNLSQYNPKLEDKICANQSVFVAGAKIVTRNGELDLLWKYKISDEMYSSSCLSADGKALYVGTNLGELIAFDSATGKKLWNFEPECHPVLSPSISPDGAVCVTNSRGYVHILKNKTGKEILKFSASHSLDGLSCITPDSVIYTVGGNNSKLYAFNSKDGQKIWQYDAADKIYNPPCMGQNNTVYIAVCNEHLYALDGRTGNEKWKFPTYGNASSPVVGLDETIYAGSNGGYLYSINSKTGEKKWESHISIWQIESPALSPDGSIVYATSYDGYICAFDSSSGRQIWKDKIDDNICSSPLPAPDGTVYVGTKGGYLYAIEGKLGKKIGMFNTRGEIIKTPCISSNGTVYVICQNGNIYALKRSVREEVVEEIKKACRINTRNRIVKDSNTVTIGAIKLEVNQRYKKI